MQQGHRHAKYVVKLFNALVNPVFTYGAPAYASMAGTHWRRLKSLHDRSLKNFLGLPSYTSYKTVCDHAFVDAIEDSIKEAAKKKVEGILKTSPFGNELYQNYEAYKNKSTHKSSMQTLQPVYSQD